MKKPKSKAAVKRLKKRIRDKQDLPPMNRTNRPMSALEEQIAEILDTLGIEWEREKASYVILMAKKNDGIKNWLAKARGYKMIRIKEKQLKEEYDTVMENISLATGKLCR